jgi:hypothetical protein
METNTKYLHTINFPDGTSTTWTHTHENIYVVIMKRTYGNLEWCVGVRTINEANAHRAFNDCMKHDSWEQTTMFTSVGVAKAGK